MRLLELCLEVVYWDSLLFICCFEWFCMLLTGVAAVLLFTCGRRRTQFVIIKQHLLMGKYLGSILH